MSDERKLDAAGCPVTPARLRQMAYIERFSDRPDPEMADELDRLARWLDQRTTAPAAAGEPTLNRHDCPKCGGRGETPVYGRVGDGVLYYARCSSCNGTAQSASEPIRGAAGTKTFWLVESVDPSSGNPEGWWFTAPPEGEGGWRTNDATKAKQYTEAEARAVAQALGYFRSPFRWSKWIATEHAWMGEEPLAQPAAPQSERRS